MTCSFRRSIALDVSFPCAHGRSLPRGCPGPASHWQELNLGSHCGSTITMNRDEHDRQTHLRVVEPSAQRTDRTMIGWPACSHRGQVATGGGGRTTIGASSQAGRRSSGGGVTTSPPGRSRRPACRTVCLPSVPVHRQPRASCSSRAVAANGPHSAIASHSAKAVVENRTRRRTVLFFQVSPARRSGPAQRPMAALMWSMLTSEPIRSFTSISAKSALKRRYRSNCGLSLGPSRAGSSPVGRRSWRASNHGMTRCSSHGPRSPPGKSALSVQARTVERSTPNALAIAVLVLKLIDCWCCGVMIYLSLVQKWREAGWEPCGATPWKAPPAQPNGHTTRPSR